MWNTYIPNWLTKFVCAVSHFYDSKTFLKSNDRKKVNSIGDLEHLNKTTIRRINKKKQHNALAFKAHKQRVSAVIKLSIRF